MKLAELTWPDVEKLSRDMVVVYPIASLEQHGRHLPFFTDSILCEAVVTRLEAALPKEILLLPVQWLGASEHHLGMGGTLTIQPDTYFKLLSEPLRCLLSAGFKRIFIINGHGGNIDGFHVALRQLILEFPEAFLSGASYWDLAAKEIAISLEGKMKHVGHACEFETSLMMHLRPELVRTSEIADGGLLFESETLRNLYIPLDMKRQTRDGTAGEPTFANAEKGKALLEIIVCKGKEVISAIRARSLPAR